MKKWITWLTLGLAAARLIIWLRPRQYIPNEIRNIMWDSGAGRWRTPAEVSSFLREHPERVPLTLSTSEARVLSYLDLIQSNAEQFNLDPALIGAIMSRESSGDYSARGAVGEYGLMQVRATTAAWLGFRGDPDKLYDPAENIRYGSMYLDYQMKRYAETAYTTSWAVAAYNAGTATQKNGRFSNQGYVDSVLIRLPRFRLLINRAMGFY